MPTDNDGVYPATEYVTYTPNDRTANNLGNRYLDTWPMNPWTGKPMANTGSDVLFNTDFASMAGLSSAPGRLEGRQRGARAAHGRRDRLAFGDATWTDVQLDVSATLNSGPGYGVYFRSDGQAQHLRLLLPVRPGLGNKFVVRKVVNGVESAPIAAHHAPRLHHYGTAHAITINAVGSHIVCKVDGVTVLDFTDSTFPSGSAGLRGWDGTHGGLPQREGAGRRRAGSGDSSKGDFAYAYAARTPPTAWSAGWPAGRPSSCSRCSDEGRDCPRTRRRPSSSRSSSSS